MLTLKRAKEISRTGEVLFASPSLYPFLQNNFNKDSFANTKGVLDKFCDLDDSDIFNAMKAWRLHPDRVLSELSSRLLDRRLFRIELRTDPFSNEDTEERVKTLMSDWDVDRDVANFYVTSGQVKNQPYKENGILIKTKDGDLIDFAKANDNLTIESLTRNVVKSFLCYPKDMPARS